jgi:hypothetical protein
VLILLLILAALAALWWGAQLLAPSQRALMRFIYSTATPPHQLNGVFPGDDVTGETAPDPAHWPTVTIIVPGRNEGHLLAHTLGSLCSMDYPSFRVIFIDDQSTDNTAAVCRELAQKHPHLSVLHNTQPPRDGWIGKTWAVHQADPYLHDSNTDYLLFTDSDLEYHPQCLRHMIRLALHRRTDITSLLPRMVCQTVGELLGLHAGMCIINSRLSLYHCNNPKIPRALVAGGFLLVKRATYHELGGHAAVRGQIVEDVAFGTRAKALRKRVFTALTHDLYRARMYEGWRDTYRGLKKNAYAGANYSLPLAAFIAGFLLFAGTLVPFYVLAALATCLAHTTALALATLLTATIALLFQTLSAARTARFVGFPAATALLTSPAFAFYLAVFLGSALDYYRGGNTWAGRQVKNAQPLASAGVVSPPGDSL